MPTGVHKNSLNIDVFNKSKKPRDGGLETIARMGTKAEPGPTPLPAPSRSGAKQQLTAKS